MLVEIKLTDFLIKDDELSKMYNKNWNKASNRIKKEFDNESIYIKSFLQTKIKSYSDDIANFRDKEMLKVDPNHICLVVILNNFVLTKDENYYKEVFLRKCKYNEKKVIRYVTDDLKISSNDSDKGGSDKKVLKIIILAMMSFLRDQLICSCF